jgi:hypothetical protein
MLRRRSPRSDYSANATGQRAKGRIGNMGLPRGTSHITRAEVDPKAGNHEDTAVSGGPIQRPVAPFQKSGDSPTLAWSPVQLTISTKQSRKVQAIRAGQADLLVRRRGI